MHVLILAETGVVRGLQHSFPTKIEIGYCGLMWTSRLVTIVCWSRDVIESSRVDLFAPRLESKA